MWWNETRPIDQTLVIRDIAEMFECTPYVAGQFLRCYGVIVGKRWAIGRARLNQLINNGDAIRYFEQRRRHKGDRLPGVRQSEGRGDAETALRSGEEESGQCAGNQDHRRSGETGVDEDKGER